MNRQQKRRAERRLKISPKELESISQQLARDSEVKNQEVIIKFLGLVDYERYTLF